MEIEVKFINFFQMGKICFTPHQKIPFTVSPDNPK